MTAVEAAAREQDHKFTTSEIRAYHSKAVGFSEVTLKNKERPISVVHLVWFGAAGESFPFVIDPELKMNNRMPFSKLKERFPNPLFSQLPCLGKGREDLRDDLRVAYCEIRASSDANNNVLKTAEYLALNKWVGIINTSEGAKVYLMPTSVASHELGITQPNHPQMLHGVFVKKNPRESRSHTHRVQHTPSPPSPEKALRESSRGNHSKHQETGASPAGVVQKRRVSFAPTLSSEPTTSDVSVPPSEIVKESQDSSGSAHKHILAPNRDATAEDIVEKVIYQEDDQVSNPLEAVPSSSTAQLVHTVTQGSPHATTSKDMDTGFSPGPEEDASEEDSIASSLSSSASVYESPQLARRGRGKRGRPRGRTKRGTRGRGGVNVEEVGGEGGEVDGVSRGRGGRGRKRRGRGSRGPRGRGRGRGGKSESVTEGEIREDFSAPPDAKRLKLHVSPGFASNQVKSVQATNTVLCQLLEVQETSITAVKPNPTKKTPVAMVSPQPSVSVVPKRLQAVSQAQVQVHMLQLQLQAPVPKQPSAQQPPQLQLLSSVHPLAVPKQPSAQQPPQQQPPSSVHPLAVPKQPSAQQPPQQQPPSSVHPLAVPKQPSAQQPPQQQPPSSVHPLAVPKQPSAQQPPQQQPPSSVHPLAVPKQPSAQQPPQQQPPSSVHSLAVPKQPSAQQPPQQQPPSSVHPLAVPKQPSAQQPPQLQPLSSVHPLAVGVEKESEAGGKSAKADLSSSSHSLPTAESDVMSVSEQEVTSVGGAESVPVEAMEEDVVRESDLQVQEEVIFALQKPPDQDSGPYFQPPRPPRRVSLLEYKERKEKKRLPSDEVRFGESEVSTTQVKESKIMQPLTEAGDETGESTKCQPKSKVQDGQSATLVISATHRHESSEFTQSAPKTTPTDSGGGDSPAMDSVTNSSPVGANKELDPHLGTSLITDQTRVPSSIEWPTVMSNETKKMVPLSVTVSPVTEVPTEKTRGVNEDGQSETVPAANETLLSEPQLHSIEESKKTQKEKEEEKRSEEKEASRKEKGQEREKEKKQAERVTAPERRGKRDRGKEWEERLEELEVEWRKKREKERKEVEEREKSLARKSVKPLESRKSSTGYSDPHLAPHSASPPFPPGQPRFPIPLHHRPGFHPTHPLPIPPPAMPPPHPPPPQPFLGFPPHPFHQPPPTPFTPSHPPQPPDIWSMFGNLFAQHNLFPTEDPPPPPPRPPSPPLPPLHYSSPRGLSPCHSSPRRMSPRHSPPPHRESSPHLSPPRSSPTPMSMSPTGPAPFHSRARSRSSSPVPKSQALDPKPRQLDAKQFRIISELIKRTTVKKCDVAVQAVPPRMVSEGTQEGRGFRLCSTAVQVKTRTRTIFTHTDLKPEVQHRYVQTSAVPTRNTSTQTQHGNGATHESGNPLVTALEAFEAVLNNSGCSYSALDTIVTKVEDWLSRQASLSTNTGSTSDYEPADMSCDEDDDHGGGDCVFVSPENPTIASPVVSGASNISEGDLSDIVSRSPSDRSKSENTDTRNDDLYSPSHPLESGEECSNEEESRLPSPPPLPLSTALLMPDPTPPPPSMLSSSTPRVTGGLPPWARGDSVKSSSNQPQCTSDTLGDDHVTEDAGEKASEERMDVEEAFADQMLEEQLSQSKQSSKLMSKRSKYPFLICSLSSDDKSEQQDKGKSEKGTRSAQQEHDKEGIKQELADHGSMEMEERQNSEATKTTQDTVTTKIACESSKRFSPSSSIPELNVDPVGKCDANGENTASVLSSRKNSSHSENISSEMQSTVEKQSRSERTREDVAEQLALSLLSVEDSSSKHLGFSSPVTAMEELNSNDQQLLSGDGLRVRIKRKLTSSTDDDLEEGEIRSPVKYRSHADSPRRSVRQRQRTEKLQATTKLSASKSEVDGTESDESSGKHVVLHKYKTRYRRRSEVEEEEQEKKSSEREDRWELRSRHKNQRDDSSAENKELRSRNKGGREDSRSKSDAKKRKGKKGQDVDQTLHEVVKQRRYQSPRPTGSERTQRKPMVPTLQAFEDECEEASAMNSQEKNQSEMQQESLVAATCMSTASEQPKLLEHATGEFEGKVNDIVQAKDKGVESGGFYLRSLSLPPFKVLKSPTRSPTDSKPLTSNNSSVSSPSLVQRSISYSPPSRKRRPTLTKDELLAMVRAKKKSELPKESPEVELGPQSTVKSSEEVESGKVELNEPMARSQLDMKEVMVNFHKHMKAVSARKVSDSSWIHPWTHASPSSSGSMIPFRQPSTYSLLHPPPPPPGPPPATSKPVSSAPTPPEQAETKQPSTVALPSTDDSSLKEQISEKGGDAEEGSGSESPALHNAEEALLGSVIETMEKRVIEEAVAEGINARIQHEEEKVQREVHFCGRVLDTLEESIVKDTVRDTMDRGITDKVMETIDAECVLQEQALETLEEKISEEVVTDTMDKGVSDKVTKQILVEEVLQGKVLKGLEVRIVKEIVADSVEKEIAKAVSTRIRAEDILQERVLDKVENAVVEEIVEGATNDEIVGKVKERVRMEGILQERTSERVEDAIVEEMVKGATNDEIVGKVKERVRMEGILQERTSERVEDAIVEEMVKGAMNDEIVGKVKERVRMEGILQERTSERVEDAIVEEMVKGATNDEIVGKVKERVRMEGILQERTSERVEDAIVEEMVKGATNDEIVGKVKERVRMEGILQERTSERVEDAIVEEMVKGAMNDEIVGKVKERVRMEGILQERTSERVEDAIVEEMVKGAMDVEIVEKVNEIVRMEDSLQETVSERVEDAIIEEMVKGAMDVEIVEKVKEIVRMEGSLQETVSEGVEDAIIEEMVKGVMDVEIVEKVKEIVRMEGSLQETVSERVEDAIVQEIVEVAVDVEIVENVKKRVRLESFLQERAVSSVETQIVEETVLKALSVKIQEEVTERIQTELEENVAELITESFLPEFEETIARETALEELTAERIATVELESLEDMIVCEMFEKEEKIILELEEIVSGELQSEYFEELKGEIIKEVTLEEEKKLSVLVENCVELVEDRFLSELQVIFVEDLMTEALNELEEKAICTVEEKYFEGIQEVAVKSIVIGMEIADKVCNNLLEQFEETVIEEMIVEEEKRVEIVEQRVTAVTEEEVLVRLENEISRNEVDREEGMSVTVEDQVSQALEGEVVDLQQETAVAEIVTERVVNELKESVCEGLEESCFGVLTGEAASDMVDSQEKTAADVEEAVSKELEDECVDEVERAAAKELTVTKEVEESVFGELESEIVSQEVLAEDTVDLLEDRVMDELSVDSATLAADAEVSSCATYEVTEVHLDGTTELSAQPKPTHIHIVEEATPPPDAELGSQVIYEVSEVVPNSLTEVGAQPTPPYVHVMDADTSAADAELEANEVSQDHNEPAATYVHIIDAPQQSALELPPASANSPTSLPSDTASHPQQSSLEVIPVDIAASSPPDITNPPQPTVFCAIFPKYISQRLRPRAAKPPLPISPHSGIKRPTPLSPTSFKRNYDDGAVEQPTPLSSEQEDDVKQSEPFFPTSEQNDGSRIQQPTPLFPSLSGKKRPTPLFPTSSKHEDDGDGIQPPTSLSPTSPRKEDDVKQPTPSSPPSPKKRKRRKRPTQLSSTSSKHEDDDGVTIRHTPISPLSPKYCKGKRRPTPLSPLSCTHEDDVPHHEIKQPTPLSPSSPHQLRKRYKGKAVLMSSVLVPGTSDGASSSDPMNSVSSGPNLEQPSPPRQQTVRRKSSRSKTSRRTSQTRMESSDSKGIVSQERPGLKKGSERSERTSSPPSESLSLVVCVPLAALVQGMSKGQVEECASVSDAAEVMKESRTEACNDNGVFAEQSGTDQIGTDQIISTTDDQVEESSVDTQQEKEISTATIVDDKASPGPSHSPLKDLPSTFSSVPLMLELPSVFLHSPEKFDSPPVSPVTGNGSSTTLSPRSPNEEMMLRLETSFSSAPETDSDQEREDCEKPQKTGDIKDTLGDGGSTCVDNNNMTDVGGRSQLESGASDELSSSSGQLQLHEQSELQVEGSRQTASLDRVSASSDSLAEVCSKPPISTVTPSSPCPEEHSPSEKSGDVQKMESPSVEMESPSVEMESPSVVMESPSVESAESPLPSAGSGGDQASREMVAEESKSNNDCAPKSPGSLSPPLSSVTGIGHTLSSPPPGMPTLACSSLSSSSPPPQSPPPPHSPPPQSPPPQSPPPQSPPPQSPPPQSPPPQSPPPQSPPPQSPPPQSPPPQSPPPQSPPPQSPPPPPPPPPQSPPPQSPPPPPPPQSPPPPPPPQSPPPQSPPPPPPPQSPPPQSPPPPPPPQSPPPQSPPPQSPPPLSPPPQSPPPQSPPPQSPPPPPPPQAKKQVLRDRCPPWALLKQIYEAEQEEEEKEDTHSCPEEQTSSKPHRTPPRSLLHRSFLLIRPSIPEEDPGPLSTTHAPSASSPTSEPQTVKMEGEDMSPQRCEPRSNSRSGSASPKSPPVAKGCESRLGSSSHGRSVSPTSLPVVKRQQASPPPQTEGNTSVLPDTTVLMSVTEDFLSAPIPRKSTPPEKSPPPVKNSAPPVPSQLSNSNDDSVSAEADPVLCTSPLVLPDTTVLTSVTEDFLSAPIPRRSSSPPEKKSPSSVKDSDPSPLSQSASTVDETVSAPIISPTLKKTAAEDLNKVCKDDPAVPSVSRDPSKTASSEADKHVPSQPLSTEASEPAENTKKPSPHITRVTTNKPWQSFFDKMEGHRTRLHSPQLSTPAMIPTRVVSRQRQIPPPYHLHNINTRPPPFSPSFLLPLPHAPPSPPPPHFLAPLPYPPPFFPSPPRLPPPGHLPLPAHLPPVSGPPMHRRPPFIDHRNRYGSPPRYGPYY